MIYSLSTILILKKYQMFFNLNLGVFYKSKTHIGDGRGVEIELLQQVPIQIMQTNLDS
jgi:hypothetical protein